MHQPSVTAILVAYNSAGVIPEALTALRKQPAVSAIVVVDNCSVDDTCDLIRRDFAGVKLIENKKNEGFGRANNIGLRKVDTPYALLVNPDAIIEDGCIDALLAAAQRYPEAAILAPQLYEADGRIHHSYKRSVFEREKDRDTYVEPSGDLCAEFLSGAVWLLNMKIMKTIGYFDPHIFLYYEDDDLCLRARKGGYGLVLVHEARAVHLMGRSSGKPKPEGEFEKQKHLICSRLYIEEKYYGVEAARKLASKLNLEYGFKAAWYCLQFNKPKFNRYRGRLAGIFEFNEKAEASKAA